jgi:hypothetical protein
MIRLSICAAAALLGLGTLGCGGPAARRSDVDRHVDRLESRDRTVRRQDPMGKTVGVSRQVKVISDGVVGAERASKVRMFDR